jgi:hypothetical protein
LTVLALACSALTVLAIATLLHLRTPSGNSDAAGSLGEAATTAEPALAV